MSVHWIVTVLPFFSPWMRGNFDPLKVHKGPLDVVAAAASGAFAAPVAATSTPIDMTRTRNASSKLLTRDPTISDPLLDNVDCRDLMARRAAPNRCGQV